MPDVDFVTRELTASELAGFSFEAASGSNGFLIARGSSGRAGRGVLMRADLSVADELCRMIAASSSDPLLARRITLFSAVGFDGSTGDVVLAHTTWGVDPDGTTWIVHPRHEPPLEMEETRPAATDGASITVRPGVAIPTYLTAVAAARDAVRNGRLTKAVIARDVIVESSRALDLAALMLRMKRAFASSYRYHFDGLIGASPELLVERDGDVVRSHPLAGTTSRTGDPVTDAALAADLLASAKNQLEHRVVIDMVHDTLLPWCSYLDWQPEPEVIAVANVQHLGTRVEGKLSNPPPHVLDLVKALVPTPALGGHPRDAALALIAEVEGVDRGPYGGAVGWMSASGEGMFAVTIRCAIFDHTRTRAQLFAGGGIVAASDPLAELDETRAKFQAMLSLLVRP